MKYDDASWHSEGDFPRDLPPENGATHLGMFFAWAVGRDLVVESHREEFSTDLSSLEARRITPGALLLRCCDGKLTAADLDDLGNEFARRYYQDEYLEDYQRVLGGQVETLYHVADTWDNFDRLKPLIDVRFTGWRAVAN